MYKHTTATHSLHGGYGHELLPLPSITNHTLHGIVTNHLKSRPMIEITETVSNKNLLLPSSIPLYLDTLHLYTIAKQKNIYNWIIKHEN